MSSVWSRVDRFWRPEAPAERLAMLRILVGLFALIYLLIRVVHLFRYVSFAPDHFSPVGITRLISEPMPGPVWGLQVLASIVLSALFVLGIRFRWVGPLCALSFLWTITYRNSWGMVFHTENLVVIHMLILSVSPAADALTWGARPSRPKSLTRYGAPIKLMCWVTALAYLVAGVAKVRNAGWTWASGDVLQVQVAYDNLRKLALGDFYSPLGAFLVPFDWLWPPLAAVALAMELLAPLAVLHTKVGKVWASVAWSFHVGVLAVMAINFPYPLSFVAYASFFDAEKLRGWAWVQRLERKLERWHTAARGRKAG